MVKKVQLVLLYMWNGTLEFWIMLAAQKICLDEKITSFYSHLLLYYESLDLLGLYFLY